MWKRDESIGRSSSVRVHLCPDCDSLGPHWPIFDDPPQALWLECIDCGCSLGRLTSEGVEPATDDRVPMTLSQGGLHPLTEATMRQVLAQTRERAQHPESALAALRLASRVGLTPRPQP